MGNAAELITGARVDAVDGTDPPLDSVSATDALFVSGAGIAGELILGAGVDVVEGNGSLLGPSTVAIDVFVLGTES